MRFLFIGMHASASRYIVTQRVTMILKARKGVHISKGRDTNGCVYPVSLYQQGTREEIPSIPCMRKKRFVSLLWKAKKKGRDTNSFAYKRKETNSFAFEKITPVSLARFLYKGRDTKYPLAERKALFYAKKGRDTNSFAYKRKENNSFAFEKITPVSLAQQGTMAAQKALFPSQPCFTHSNKGDRKKLSSFLLLFLKKVARRF